MVVDRFGCACVAGLDKSDELKAFVDSGLMIRKLPIKPFIMLF